MSGVADMSDLTDRRNGLRIVVTAEARDSAETIRDQLLALTPWSPPSRPAWSRLDEDRVPRWWTVRELIGAFLHLRDSVVLRRSEYRLEKVTARRHLVSGPDADPSGHRCRGGGDPRVRHRRRRPPRPAGALLRSTRSRPITCLALQLRRLTKLDVIELQAEADKLDAEFLELTELVTNPDARRKVIDKELVETAKLFKGPEFDRRTVLDAEATPVTAGTDDGRAPRAQGQHRLATR